MTYSQSFCCSAGRKNPSEISILLRNISTILMCHHRWLFIWSQRSSKQGHFPPRNQGRGLLLKKSQEGNEVCYYWFFQIPMVISYSKLITRQSGLSEVLSRRFVLHGRHPGGSRRYASTFSTFYPISPDTVPLSSLLPLLTPQCLTT